MPAKSKKPNRYFRNCPGCNTEIGYYWKYVYNNATKNNSKCQSCSNLVRYNGHEKEVPEDVIFCGNFWIRQCKNKKQNPNCSDIIIYTSKHPAISASKNNRECLSCSTFKPSDEWLDKKSKSQKLAIHGSVTAIKEYESKQTDRQLYYKEVMKITNRQPIHLLENYDKRGKAGLEGAYQLDHIYPISKGFDNNIPAEIIGSIDNLQMLTWEENTSKSNRIIE